MKNVYMTKGGAGFFTWGVRTKACQFFTGSKPQCARYYRHMLAIERAMRTQKGN